MSILQVILAVVLPPLAVYKRGWSAVIVVAVLTLCAWFPGMIAALLILNNTQKDLLNADALEK